jgi:hypothetical protein
MRLRTHPSRALTHKHNRSGQQPSYLLARLGMPALAVLVFLAILVLGVICWIINSGDRPDR